MKRLSAITMLLLLLSCNNEPEEPQVMTRQGALEAELQHADKVREYLIQGTDLQQVPLTDDQIFDLKTEYAYWTTMSVFFYKVRVWRWQNLEEGKEIQGNLNASSLIPKEVWCWLKKVTKSKHGVFIS